MTKFELLTPLAQASSDAYTTANFFESAACQVSLFMLGGVVTFAFRGTKTPLEWMVDFLAVPDPFGHPGGGTVHAGMELDTRIARGRIRAWLIAHGWPRYRFTGHSKGAGEAELATGDFLDDPVQPLPTWVFEAPHIGSVTFTNRLLPFVQWTQTANKDGPDIVTTVPGGTPLWTPVGPPLRLTVPDSYGVVQKHEITTVQTAITMISPIDART